MKRITLIVVAAGILAALTPAQATDRTDRTDRSARLRALEERIQAVRERIQELREREPDAPMQREGRKQRDQLRGDRQQGARARLGDQQLGDRKPGAQKKGAQKKGNPKQDNRRRPHDRAKPGHRPPRAGKARAQNRRELRSDRANPVGRRAGGRRAQLEQFRNRIRALRDARQGNLNPRRGSGVRKGRF